MKKVLVGLSLILAVLAASAANVTASDGSPVVVTDGSRLVSAF